MVTNPDGQWRSVQSTEPIKHTKTYVRIQLTFNKNKAKFKYVGLAPKFTTTMQTKGNRINPVGIFVGSGGSQIAEKPQYIQTLNHVNRIESNQDCYGLFINADGVEHQLSETTHLVSGDVIGLRLDRDHGTVGFDLNGVDYGIVYRHQRFRSADIYPTADLGMGQDSALFIHAENPKYRSYEHSD